MHRTNILFNTNQWTLLLKITAEKPLELIVPITIRYFFLPSRLRRLVFSSSWARTSDLPVNSRVLCLLSYRGKYHEGDLNPRPLG